MKFLNFRTHFGGTFKNENKIGKNIRVWGVIELLYKFGSLIYIILAIYLKLKYGDFLLIDIVMIIFPIKFFCIGAVSMVELASTEH